MEKRLIVATYNMTLEEKQRYMDDIRLWCYSVRLGWRWKDGELVFSMQWREKELAKNMTGLEKTTEILKAIMNSITNPILKK